MTVYSREKDLEVVQQAVDSAKKRYSEISGREVEVEIEAGLDDDLYVSFFLPFLSRRGPVSASWPAVFLLTHIVPGYSGPAV